MMRLHTPPRRQREATVPMINVGFLLLIFFLMAAVIAPPDALDTVPPEAESDAVEAPQDVLLIDAEGRLALGVLRGEEVFGALPDGALAVRADGALSAAKLADVLRRLSEAGVRDVRLLTIPR